MTNTVTLEQLITDHHITIDARRVNSNPNMSGMPNGSSHWEVTFIREGYQSIPFAYSMGPALKTPPACIDVLECLLLDAASSYQPFEQWATDCGYDTDSRKAYATWEAVKINTIELMAFLGPLMDAFVEAQNNG